MGQATLSVFVEPGVLDGDSGLVGQGLEHHQVALVEGAQLVAFDIQHTDDSLLSLERHGQLRSGLGGVGQEEISRLLAHVGRQQRLTCVSYPGRDPLPTNFEGWGAKLGITPVGLGSRLEHQFIALDQANSDLVISKGLFQ